MKSGRANLLFFNDKDIALAKINEQLLKQYKSNGIADTNKLYIKNNQSLEGTSFLKHTNKANKHYFVTQIRKNLSYT